MSSKSAILFPLQISPIWLGKSQFTKKTVSDKVRRQVFDRDGHRCAICSENGGVAHHRLSQPERPPHHLRHARLAARRAFGGQKGRQQEFSNQISPNAAETRTSY